MPAGKKLAQEPLSRTEDYQFRLVDEQNVLACYIMQAIPDTYHSMILALANMHQIVGIWFSSEMASELVVTPAKGSRVEPFRGTKTALCCRHLSTLGTRHMYDNCSIKRSTVPMGIRNTKILVVSFSRTGSTWFNQYDKLQKDLKARSCFLQALGGLGLIGYMLSRVSDPRAPGNRWSRQLWCGCKIMFRGKSQKLILNQHPAFQLCNFVLWSKVGCHFISSN